MSEIQGSWDPKFEKVRDLFAEKVADGSEVGASLHVTVDGKDVIDIWGGWREREHLTPWDEHTVVNVFSGSKPVTSLALLMMVDRGLLDLDAPVADYWPEFAQNGKEGVLVRHLMSHTAGLPAWLPPFSFEEAANTELSTARLAAQAPWWEPGTRGSYHASSFGHLNAELARRVCGRPLREFIRDEIATPLQADFFLGLEDAQMGQVATIYPDSDAPKSAPKPAGKVAVPAGEFNEPTEEEVIAKRTREGSFSGTLGDEQTVFNSTEWRRTDFAGSSGHANGRGLGRIISALANGGTSQGVKLLSQATIDQIFREQASGIDAYYMKPIHWGIGYALAPQKEKERGPLPFLKPGPRTCYWYGTGGALVLADLGNRLSIGYAMNQCQSGRSSLNGVYYNAIYDCL
ncbi:serine hydrolase domain-containing protein [Allosediminivita pacifica]|uniref:CubicO group peptidase (Beta-lactamase class C family) n=1 Tax=Allosediminivita pacifica TaxID=1267769 RepID=A0A2T6A7K2_9RHOB|nr:serine hydrolase domain-containing protein [Allosediminivita pacifica]PTX39799.1 CubicO group peptidase (beta-lactamase class C family) [Allosediminivita pacifica]GGB27250.1 EstA family serine hydrolase [Allosediminivita pacifica]